MSNEPIEIINQNQNACFKKRNRNQKWVETKDGNVSIFKSLSSTKSQVLRTRPMSVHFLSACGVCASFVLSIERSQWSISGHAKKLAHSGKTNLDMTYHDIPIAYRTYIINQLHINCTSIVRILINYTYICVHLTSFDIIWHIHPLIHDKWLLNVWLNISTQSCGVAAAQRATEGSSALAVCTVLSTVRGEGSIHWPLRHWDKQKRQRVIW